MVIHSRFINIVNIITVNSFLITAYSHISEQALIMTIEVYHYNCLSFSVTVGTIIVTEWRTKYRRKMNLLDNAKSSKAVDSLINFETVKYYGNADFESNMYSKAIVDYQVNKLTFDYS